VYGVLISSGGLRVIEFRVPLPTLRGLDAVFIAFGGCKVGLLAGVPIFAVLRLPFWFVV
jgi:hypothetical protein